MASCQCEVDPALLKFQRASLRSRQLRIKRSELERRQSARSQPPLHAAQPSSGVKLHRLARAAIRTRLASGVLETTSDLPAVVSVGCSGQLQRRKPNVASVLSFQRSAVPASEPRRCTDEFLREFFSAAAEDCAAWKALCEHLPEREYLPESESSATDDLDTCSSASCAPATSEDRLDTARSSEIVVFQDDWEVLPASDSPVVVGSIWSLVA